MQSLLMVFSYIILFISRKVQYILIMSLFEKPYQANAKIVLQFPEGTVIIYS